MPDTLDNEDRHLVVEMDERRVAGQERPHGAGGIEQPRVRRGCCDALRTFGRLGARSAGDSDAAQLNRPPARSMEISGDKISDQSARVS